MGGVDAATCAFGDASALGPGFQLTSVGNESSFRLQDFTQEGFPLIAYVTMDDTAMEVEVLRDEAGAIVAARIELVAKRFAIQGYPEIRYPG